MSQHSVSVIYWSRITLITNDRTKYVNWSFIANNLLTQNIINTRHFHDWSLSNYSQLNSSWNILVLHLTLPSLIDIIIQHCIDLLQTIICLILFMQWYLFIINSTRSFNLPELHVGPYTFAGQRWITRMQFSSTWVTNILSMILSFQKDLRCSYKKECYHDAYQTLEGDMTYCIEHGVPLPLAMNIGYLDDGSWIVNTLLTDTAAYHNGCRGRLRSYMVQRTLDKRAREESDTEEESFSPKQNSFKCLPIYPSRRALSVQKFLKDCHNKDE